MNLHLLSILSYSSINHFFLTSLTCVFLKGLKISGNHFPNSSMKTFSLHVIHSKQRSKLVTKEKKESQWSISSNRISLLAVLALPLMSPFDPSSHNPNRGFV